MSQPNLKTSLKSVKQSHKSRDVSLADYSTFKIGGKAEHLWLVYTVEGMQEAISYAKQAGLPLLVIGKGSNSLFSDSGFAGLVVVNKIDFCTETEGLYHVGAGYSFSLLGTQSARRYAGLEFASGIPGSVGGAIYMNAGANGQETAGTLVSCDVLTPDGKFLTLTKEELGLSYRTSRFQKSSEIILSACFQLKADPEAKQRQLSMLEYRKKTQPYSEPSIGCIFANPKIEGCLSAGALIEKAGLKGYQIGGAKVSPVHANFIVNTAEATASDVRALAEHVQTTVYAQFGVHIHPEARIHTPT